MVKTIAKQMYPVGERIKTKTIQVYSFEELPEAKQHEIMYQSEYPWSYENRDTLIVFTNIFDFVNITDYEYGYRNYINYSLNYDDEIKALTGHRLAKWLYNNYYHQITKDKWYYKNNKSRYSKIQISKDCVLTGYYMDDYILQPIYDFIDKPIEGYTINDIINDCLNAWIDACNNDYEAYYSIDNMIESYSRYLFDEYGNIVG
jgi:hypothetical protein